MINQTRGLFLLGAIAAALSFSGASHAATVYVPDYGDTGPQTFNYIFANDFSGVVTIGVSDQNDFTTASYLDLTSSYGIILDTESVPVDTSAYLNTQGANGTDGGVYAFSLTANKDDALSFNWAFSTIDFSPYNDFAFIDIGGIHYEVLAEIQAVPVPAAAWLLGSGLLGLIGVARRKTA